MGRTITENLAELFLKIKNSREYRQRVVPRRDRCVKIATEPLSPNVIPRRFVGRALSVAAALCLFGSPAAAAIDADFNGDGVIDRVVLPKPPDTNILVHFSHGAPQILKFHDRIISIVATDINHDGEIDIGALSERRGIFIWLNKGKAGHGRLKTLKRRHHRGGFSLTTRGPLASAPGSPVDGPAATGPQDDRSACHDRITPEFTQEVAATLPSPLAPPLPDAHGVRSPSRAPPSGHD
jgi:hypothetical protein